MSYDKDGLGFMELVLVELYFPEIMETMSEATDEEKLEVYRKTIDCHNLGLI